MVFVLVLFEVPLVALTLQSLRPGMLYKCLFLLPVPVLLLPLADGWFCSGVAEGQGNQLCWDQAGGAGALSGISDFVFVQ